MDAEDKVRVLREACEAIRQYAASASDMDRVPAGLVLVLREIEARAERAWIATAPEPEPEVRCVHCGLLAGSVETACKAGFHSFDVVRPLPGREGGGR